MIYQKVYNVIFVVGVLIILTFSSAASDSAGIVEMVDGLAYGGIPYGSVSGMLKNYHDPITRNDSPQTISQILYQPNQQYYQGSTAPIIVTPNLRAPGLTRRQRGPVQIYSLPGVIAPGVVGTISQIGY